MLQSLEFIKWLHINSCNFKEYHYFLNFTHLKQKRGLVKIEHLMGLLTIRIQGFSQLDETVIVDQLKSSTKSLA